MQRTGLCDVVGMYVHSKNSKELVLNKEPVVRWQELGTHLGPGQWYTIHPPVRSAALKRYECGTAGVRVGLGSPIEEVQCGG